MTACDSEGIGDRGERSWKEDEAKEHRMGRKSFHALHGEKMASVRMRLKKNVERESRREGEKWVKVRVDDRLKNEEGEENPA